MKHTGVSGSTFTKNQQIFQELCVLQPERFLYRLMEIRKLFGLPEIKEVKLVIQVIGDTPSQEDWNSLTGVVSKCETNRLLFLKNLNNKAKNVFHELIDHILVDNKLGREWKYSLIDVVVNGFFVPPIYNLRIETNAKKKTLRLILNPDTSLEDIKAAWGLIQKEKERVLGKISKRNLSKKSAKHLIDFAKTKQIQKLNPQIKGMELVAAVYPGSDDEKFPLPTPEADAKAANNLRQIKHRLAHKM